MRDDKPTDLSQVVLGNIKGLPKEALRNLRTLVESVLEEEQTDVKLQQVRDIVPIDKWLNSSYYLGDMSRSLYPFWRTEIADFISKGYNEWVVTGAIGTGKSTAGLVTVIRKIYELSCYVSPQKLFRLADVSRIFFVYFSINERQAELTGFGQLRDTIDDIPYFKECFQRNDKVDSILEFPSRIFFLPGSDTQAVAGTNLLCAYLDETNFYKQGGTGNAGDLDKALKMYAEVTDRRKSRFLYGGKDPGFSLLVSSSTHESSFTQTRMKSKDSNIKVTVATPWEVKEKGTFSEKRFFVFKGSRKVDPFIVDDVSDFRNIIDSQDDRSVVEKAIIHGLGVKGDLEDKSRAVVNNLPSQMSLQFVAVPVDFKKSFETHIFTALRNLAGVSTSPGGQLFTAKNLWEKCISTEISHPFTREDVCVSLRQPGEIQDFFRTESYFRKEGDIYLPIRHPGEKRYVHIDQSSSNDCTGLSCVHRAGYIVDEINKLVQPVIEVDFVLRIKPPKRPDRISIAKIRRFLFWLRSNNVHFGYVSYDQHQSEESLQTLQTHKINCGRVSVDKDDKSWIDVCNLIYENRIRLYRYAPLEMEWFSLMHDSEGHKVDHPKKNEDGSVGSKDISDALVGSICTCLTKHEDRSISVKENLSNIQISFAREGQSDDVDFNWVLEGSKAMTPEQLSKVKIDYDRVDFKSL